ncbi:MAG: hypothetical protein LBJ20_05530 [Candidatus Methanoplasma sp.]|jgi:Arc/MetJ-type ribon-helix-helix transcriptional regulator|nr:hypothetical protein [Candidatus Methanoplasma sp.]
MKCKTDAVSIRLTEAERKKIGQCVECGDALNSTDFIRQAIRDKLAKSEASA